MLGTVLMRSLSTRLDETPSDSVKAALPPGRLDAIKNDPRALVDPVAADALMARLKDIGPDVARMADTLLGSLNTALAEAVGDVFAVGAVVVVLSPYRGAVPTYAGPRTSRHAAHGTHGSGNKVPGSAQRADRVLRAGRPGSWHCRHESPGRLAGAAAKRQLVEHPGPLVRVMSI